jgi:hypothetical protein
VPTAAASTRWWFRICQRRAILLNKARYWRSFGAACLGATGVVGFAPLGWFPVNWLSLGGLFALLCTEIDGGGNRPAWRGARIAAAHGLGLFLAGVSWVYVSLSVFGGMPAAVAGLATVLFCLVLAIFPALAGALFVGFAVAGWWRRGLLFASLWVLAECLRAWAFTGFPWLAAGYSQTPPSPLAGYAALLGVHGVSFFSALLGALIFEVSRRCLTTEPCSRAERACYTGRQVSLMASRSLALVPVSCVLLASSLVGCDPAVVPDAGTDAPVMRDAGPPPPPYTCEGTPTRVTGVLGATESVTFDTTMTTTRPRDLGLRCGNASAEVRWARQEVVEYVVPGSGPVAIEFSSVNSVTSPTFNTVIQVRRSCSEVPDQAFPPTCIDDTTRTEVRASGAYQAMGGETLYFIITGYSDPEPVTGEVDEGPIQVDFTPRSNTPPTITSASAAISGPAMAFSATANDAEGPIFGFALQLFTAAGQIDLEGDGDADSQVT